jgi:hypothetical protein
VKLEGNGSSYHFQWTTSKGVTRIAAIRSDATLDPHPPSSCVGYPATVQCRFIDEQISHEIYEAVTDPMADHGWRAVDADSGGETGGFEDGDLCNHGISMPIDGVIVTTPWSFAKSQCNGPTGLQSFGAVAPTVCGQSASGFDVTVSCFMGGSGMRYQLVSTPPTGVATNLSFSSVSMTFHVNASSPFTIVATNPDTLETATYNGVGIPPVLTTK